MNIDKLKGYFRFLLDGTEFSDALTMLLEWGGDPASVEEMKDTIMLLLDVSIEGERGEEQ